MALPEPLARLTEAGGYPVRITLNEAPHRHEWIGRLLPSPAGELLVEVDPPREIPVCQGGFRSTVGSEPNHHHRLRLTPPAAGHKAGGGCNPPPEHRAPATV